MNDLSDEGFWKYKTAIRVEVLTMALEVLNHSVDMDAAKATLTKFRDSYALAQSPFVRDESTDHLL
jgi:hypothetical protein